MYLNPADIGCKTVVPTLSPSCIRKFLSKNKFRYEPYKMKVISSPRSGRVTPYVSLPSSTRKAKSPSFKKQLPVRRQVLPSETPAPIPQVRYATVQFKYEVAHFVAPFRVAVGDRVVVEGDRGTHFGTVLSISTEPAHPEVARRVLRRATASDLEAFHLQKEHEIEAVSVATSIAASCRLNKDATIVDAEFQFDGQKLTIYVSRVSKTVFVDFRKLQRGLYKEYHCRIWCAYLDEINTVGAEVCC